ncbi:MAG: 16S rRNA (adenine(1518)-N(6)/adenine(1519)-N(6))-dimethyltransferase RsmA [Patescibacteria group bacterium]
MKSLITLKKSLGQNFLINPRILDKIVKTAEISKEDIILEVGPGTGNLTEKLAETLRQRSGQGAGRIIAIEKDRRLIEPLKEKFKNTNVEIVEGDILKFKNQILNFKDNKYKIVGNIPYYITSRFLRTIFEKWPRPKLVVLTIQKEVAQRIVAKPPHMNLLAVSIQFFAEPKIISYISKENFRPIPKVDSAIIKLTPRSKFYILNSKSFFNVVRAGFSQKRKLLVSNLEKSGFNKNSLTANFKKLGINPESRAENLSIGEWIELSKILIIK